jgi:hypothetical protein
MAKPTPAETAHALVVAHVDTLEKLQVVVAIAADPARTWTLDEIALEVGQPALHVRKAIDALRASGVIRLVPGPRYRFVFAPAAGDLAAACTVIADAYADDRDGLTRAVRSAELDRARSPADELVSAFQIRVLKEDGGDE